MINMYKDVCAFSNKKDAYFTAKQMRRYGYNAKVKKEIEKVKLGTKFKNITTYIIYAQPKKAIK